MGKIRRVRQKFHQNVSTDRSDGSIDSSFDRSFENQLTGKSPLLKTQEEFAAIPDNLFEGININFDDIKKKLEDDRVSVKSIAKSCKYDCKGKLLKKKERKKLKHDLFMRKINTVEQLKKEALQKHKKRKGLRKSDNQINTNIEQPQTILNVSLENSVSESKSNASDKLETTKRCKGIKKAKVRRMEMLQELSAFQKILSDSKFTKDPFGTISESVRKRIIGEIKEIKEDKKKKKQQNTK